ncbi:MAG: hypothetical protein JSU83_07940 [Deltaproteobacteria bacterium]|nr:MAG: hypothetical protein JSU83_07940 [Deltaproteobacteria bacterium]
MKPIYNKTLTDQSCLFYLYLDIDPDLFHGIIIVCIVRLQVVGYRTWLPSDSRLDSGFVHHIKCAIEDDDQARNINQVETNADWICFLKFSSTYNTTAFIKFCGICIWLAHFNRYRFLQQMADL